MSNSWLCVDANLVIRLVADPKDRSVRVLWEQWDAAGRQLSLPATYDAHYLALAEWLGGEFWTADGPLARTVQPVLPWVHLVG